MPGLSAKVFRTYNASETLQNELPTADKLRGLSVGDKVRCVGDARATPSHLGCIMSGYSE
jgi:DNA topoisomerase I